MFKITCHFLIFKSIEFFLQNLEHTHDFLQKWIRSKNMNFEVKTSNNFYFRLLAIDIICQAKSL